MGQGIHADPPLIADLAERSTQTAMQLVDGAANLSRDATVEPQVFGNSVVAPEVYQAYAEGVMRSAERALANIAGVYEVDADDLFTTAFAYQQGDREAARKIFDAWVNDGGLSR